MQTRFLRDRLQRCRGELSQISGMVDDLQRAEGPAPGGPTAARAGWGGYEHGAGGAQGFAAMGGRQQPSHRMAMLQRIRQAADRCAATLSDVEREVDVLTGSARATGGPSDRWASPMWSAQSSWSTASDTIAAGGYRRPLGFMRPRSLAVQGSDQTATAAHDDASFFRGPGRRGRWGSSRPGSLPASQQGGLDYGYVAAGAWQREPVTSGRRGGGY